jgi:hypothetical protein
MKSRRSRSHLRMMEALEPRVMLSSVRANASHFHFEAVSPPAYHAPPAVSSKPSDRNEPTFNTTDTPTTGTVTAAAQTALVAPGASLGGATASEIDLGATAATGGSGAYAYQWYRSDSAGFTPSPGTLLPGATTRTWADTASVAPGVPYFYILAVSDGISTAYSNQVIGALAIPTTPMDIPYQVGPVMLAYIGSSTWAINQGSGQIPVMIDGNLRGAYVCAILSTDNGAVSGYTTTSFLPGTSANNAVKTVVMNFQGYKILRLMIGSNDAAQGRPVAAWLANMQTIIQDALTWPVDRIVLEEIGLRLDGGNPTLDLIRQYNAARVGLLNSKVLLGTAHTFENQAIHFDTLSGDRIHQTNVGQIELAANQTTEVTGVFTVPTDYYVSVDPTHTYLHVSQGASPGGTLLNQYSLTSAPPLTLTLSNPGQAVYIDFANGSPLGAGIIVDGGSASSGKLFIVGQSGSQVFTMTDFQIAPAAGGGVVSFQNIGELHLDKGIFNYSGDLATIGVLDVGVQASFNWS